MLEVLKRPQWQIVLVILLLAAAVDAPASFAAILLALILALVFVLGALYALGIENPFNPLDHLRAMFRQTSFLKILVAGLLIAAAYLVLFAGQGLVSAAGVFASWTGGDENLFLALIFSFVAAIFCLLMTIMKSRQLKQLLEEPRGLFNDPATRSVENLLASQRYWSEASSSLFLVTAALVPAALLANWAWNTVASVALPLLVLSCRDAFHRPNPS